MSYDSRPIGVFDSGIGGLTVVQHLMRVLPHEHIIYFGDTARVPYGSRSTDVVERYAVEDASFLLAKDVKAIVVACNTVSAVGLGAVRAAFDIPLLGVIEPGARAAARATRSNRIGVIGTVATIASCSYTTAIHAINPSIEVIGIACPLFVPLAEEGWTGHPATRLVAEEYLSTLRSSAIDTLVLGCTHYPLLHDLIQDVVGSDVRIINSGEETAYETTAFLTQRGLLVQGSPQPSYRFFVSDSPEKFRLLGERFLGMPLSEVVKVDITTDAGH
jgi:glutamate racemase